MTKSKSQRPKTNGQGPKAKDRRPKTKGQRPKTEDQRPKTKGQRPKAKDQMTRLLQPVIRSFLGDDYVVDVRLFQTSRSDPQEPRLLLKLFDVMTSGVTHS